MSILLQSIDEKLNTDSFFVVKTLQNCQQIVIKSFSGTNVSDKPGCFLTQPDLKAFFKKRKLPIIYLLVSINGEKLFKCRLCNTSFSDYSNVIVHECNNKVKTQLKISRKRIKTIEEYKCQECHKCFKMKYLLKRHSTVHTQEKPFVCVVCGRSFSSQSSHISHLQIHTRDKLYSCEICNKSFLRKPKLKIHIRSHTKEKPFECKVCNKRFPESYKLSVHYRLHTGEKPYECEMCGKFFRDVSTRKKHERSHMKKILNNGNKK